MTIKPGSIVKSFSLLAVVALYCATFLAYLTPSSVTAAPAYVSL